MACVPAMHSADDSSEDDEPLSKRDMHSADDSSEDDEPLSKRVKQPAKPKSTPATEPADAGSIEFADLIQSEHAAFDALKAARLRVWKEQLIERPAARAYHIASDRCYFWSVRQL